MLIILMTAIEIEEDIVVSGTDRTWLSANVAANGLNLTRFCLAAVDLLFAWNTLLKICLGWSV